MKKIILLVTFALTGWLCNSISLAQTNVYFYFDSISIYDTCQIPTNLSFYITAERQGASFAVGATATVKIFYGDGNSDTLTPTIYSSVNAYFNTGLLTNYYSFTGTYNQLCVINWPDGQVDSATNVLNLSSNCGNITGRAYIDQNGNCTFDGNDLPLAYNTLKSLSNNGSLRYGYTDNNGFYEIHGVPISGTHVVELASPYWNAASGNVLCPSSGNITVTSIPSSGHDFAVQYDTSGFDLMPYLFGWGFRPGGGSALIYLTALDIHSNPNQTIASVTGINYDSLYEVANAYIPTIGTVFPSTDTLTFNIPSIQYNTYWSGSIANLDCDVDTTAQQGDSVCYTAYVTPLTGDADTVNNNITQCWEVTNSWDPNYKAVVPAGQGTPGFVPENLTMVYTIHFQNTGSAEAINIFIKDTIDHTVLDINTMHVIGASHPMKAQIGGADGNIFKFKFDNINLPDSLSDPEGSQGYVIYTIKQLPNLSEGTVISGNAAIYFDYNEPVITNHTLNTIEYGTPLVFNIPDPIVDTTGNTDTTVVDSVNAIRDFQSDKNMLLYPNPASSELNVTLGEEILKLHISTIDGRRLSVVVNTGTKGAKQARIGLDKFATGTYILSIEDSHGKLHHRKFVIER